MMKRSVLTSNYLSAAKQQASLYRYPYFEIAFWTDKSGLQQKKFM